MSDKLEYPYNGRVLSNEIYYQYTQPGSVSGPLCRVTKELGEKTCCVTPLRIRSRKRVRMCSNVRRAVAACGGRVGHKGPAEAGVDGGVHFPDYGDGLTSTYMCQNS